MSIENIKIAGAGPAGLTAAINLVKAGYQVDVFEKNYDTGIRFNGDLQGLENWSRRKDVIDELHDMNIKSTDFNYTGFKNLIISNGTKDYSFIVNQIHNSTDSLKYLKSFYNFNILQKIIHPFSLMYMKKRYPQFKVLKL